jgi:cytochrome P450
MTTFMDMDGADHARYRRLLTAEFAHRRIHALGPHVQQICDDIVDGLSSGPGPIDLVESFAILLPSAVISSLLGVPPADHLSFLALSRDIVSSASSAERSVAAAGELLEYLTGLTARKLADPDDDLVSRIAAKAAGLSVAELATTLLVVLVAGHETTSSMIALGLLVLMREPGALDAIRTGGVDLDAVVDELLRYVSVVQSGRRRVALEDLEIGGCTVRRGEGIVAATDLANRDPEAFGDPDRIDLHRAGNPHLAFGAGPHQCLGQTLARLELTVAYRTVAERIPGLRMAAPVEELRFDDESVVYRVMKLSVLGDEILPRTDRR